MRRSHLCPRMFRVAAGCLTLVLLYAMPAPAQSPGTRAIDATPEQRADRHFESLRKSPPQMLAFLLKMPKGADLHNHLSGAIYAESYIQWAAEGLLCVDIETMALSLPPPTRACDPSSQLPPASTALRNSVLYRKMIDAWSMRNWQLSGQSGHDHFFDTFGKFGYATYNQTGRMLAEVAARAARGNVSYLELMLTPDEGKSSDIGRQVGWDGNVESTLTKLKSNGIEGAAAIGIKKLQEAEAEKDKLLRCGTAQADPGCQVTIRYIAQVSRNSSLGQVYGQMANGLALANDPKSKVVAVTLVQAEDALASMQNFNVQMEMLKFLRSVYPQARLALHAGELAPGLVPPEGLTFHVRESVMTARAERIGHGVDIMHEDEPYELLREMARRNVLVEICLSSNDLILGISGRQHPLAIYLEYGVPVALATDDEGVSRSEISQEFLKAAEDHGLGYAQLKKMARSSLQHAFISGDSLWGDGQKFVPKAQCSSDVAAMKLTSTGCQQFVASSEKAKLQWKLEEAFQTFERQF